MTHEPSADPGAEVGGHIEIHREDGYRADSLVRYRIIIDGESRGHIGEGETRRLSVHPGIHRVWLTSYRVWRSPARDVEVPAGTTARMRCRPGAGFQAARIFDLENYLSLTQELDQPEAPLAADPSPPEGA